MGKVVFYGAISLDGYLADDNDNLQWLFDTDLAGISTYKDFEEKVAAVVMGRVTYDEVIGLLKGEPLYPQKKKLFFPAHELMKFRKAILPLKILLKSLGI